MRIPIIPSDATICNAPIMGAKLNGRTLIKLYSQFALLALSLFGFLGFFEGAVEEGVGGDRSGHGVSLRGFPGEDYKFSKHG